MSSGNAGALLLWFEVANARREVVVYDEHRLVRYDLTTDDRRLVSYDVQQADLPTRARVIVVGDTLRAGVALEGPDVDLRRQGRGSTTRRWPGGEHHAR